MSLNVVVTLGDAPEPDIALGARGRRLWDALLGEADYGPRQVALIEEACRLVDRLNVLDGAIRDKAVVFELVLDEDGEIATVVVDKALAEARQHALALKQIFSEIRQGGAESKRGEEDDVDEVARARALRLANTAG